MGKEQQPVDSENARRMEPLDAAALPAGALLLVDSAPSSTPSKRTQDLLHGTKPCSRGTQRVNFRWR
jgi:hypothetical protein